MHAHVKLVSLKILCWLLMDICLVSVEWSDQHDVCFIYILNIIIQLYNYAIELMLKNPPDKYWSVGIIPPKQAPVSICFPNRLKRSIEMIWPILRRGSVSLKWGYPNKNWKPGFHGEQPNSLIVMANNQQGTWILPNAMCVHAVWWLLISSCRETRVCIHHAGKITLTRAIHVASAEI